jgi:hypothetical protein
LKKLLKHFELSKYSEKFKNQLVFEETNSYLILLLKFGDYFWNEFKNFYILSAVLCGDLRDLHAILNSPAFFYPKKKISDLNFKSFN